MITVSPRLKLILQEPIKEGFYLVKIGDYTTTSFYRDLTTSDGVVYLADGRLASVEPPQLSTVVDRALYKVQLVDPGMEFGPMVEANLVGKSMTVRAGFLDMKTGQPLLNIEDTILIYGGTVDSAGYTVETGEQGQSILAINGSSPMGDLDSKRVFYTSRDYIRGRNPTDSCFDQVYTGSGSVNLKWGKK